MILDSRPDIRKRLLDVTEIDTRWLDLAPGILNDLVTKWDLVVGDQCWGAYAYVVPVQRGGVDFVLKLSPPEILSREVDALRSFDGRGAARVLEVDERGAMLMERVTPGEELTKLFHEGKDVEATSIACEVFRRLPKESAQETVCPTAAERASGLANLRPAYDGGAGPLPLDLVIEAEGLFKELVASQSEQVMIHGDLHHENILSSEREGWLVIDPHGLIAEPAFEVYSLLLNPDGIAASPDLVAITRRRIDQMTDDLGYPRERIRGWGLACAVLSAWWSLEGHGEGYEDAITIAQAIRQC